MKDKPLVSIALCTYNGEKYISQQLDSILNQTYRNLEIIIADDHSTDNTFKIVSSYAKKDNRIKCFNNEVNIGFNKNFEQAIKLTTGDYIAISDQDDIWLPQKIELLLNGITDKWLIFSNSVFINDNNEIIEGKVLNVFNPALHNYKSMLLDNFVTGHTTLFKREFINNLLPLIEKGFYDWWMGFIALYHQKITFLDSILTQYRIHDESVMQSRLTSGQEKQEAIKTIDNMLTAFASYKHLESGDKEFITKLKEAYKRKLYHNDPVPLVKIIFKNYSDIFAHQKNRTGLSLLNFVLKYVRKIKQQSPVLSSKK